MTKKASKKPSARALVPQAHGGALLPGAGGGRQNGLLGGRPPDEFKRRMREIASSDEALAYLDACVRGEHGEQAAIKAAQYAAERGYGKEAQIIAGDKDRPLEVVVRSE